MLISLTAKKAEVRDPVLKCTALPSGAPVAK